MTKIIEVDINEIMERSFETYAFEVIEDRALPDVRDGLKPVHRRILYSANELGLKYDRPHKKSARLVGEVLGKYHPHGDSSVYDALVRMAQDFSMRYPLLDGHGNFGSIDGDKSASMRYTEIRKQSIAEEILKDINKNTVNFIPNFDGEEQEPSVLPSLLPNLLINGSSGVAVGFATEIPPHNLNNVVDSIIHQIDYPNCSIEDLVTKINAPDFPTGGVIINPQDLLNIYTTGKGGVKLRAKYHIETIKNKETLIIDEIPYKENKSKLIEGICELTKDKVVTDKKTKKFKTVKGILSNIVQITDESDREGMRIVIEFKDKKISNNTLSLIFKHTKLQITYSVNNTAVFDKELLEDISLKQLIEYYINHQKEVIYKSSTFDLNKNIERLHIVEGLKKALENS